MYARRNAGRAMRGNARQYARSAGSAKEIVKMSAEIRAGNARKRSANHNQFVRIVRDASGTPGTNMKRKNVSGFVMPARIVQIVKTARMV